jgi:hypothetical protein
VNASTPHGLTEVNFASTLQSTGKVRPPSFAKNIRIVRRRADADGTSRSGKRVAQVMSLEIRLSRKSHRFFQSETYQSLELIRSKIVFVLKHNIVRRLRRAFESLVGQKEEVE